MEAIEFVQRYPLYIEQLAKVIKPEYKTTLTKLKELDPHDIVRLEHYFNSEAEATGIVFRRFFKLTNPGPIKLSKQEKQLRLEQDIEAAKQLLASNGIQSQGLWCIDDIIDKAKELKKPCSKKDARIILARVEKDFDASLGIAWQTIEDYVADCFRDKNRKRL